MFNKALKLVGIDPSHWPSKSVSCGGDRQSPININPALAVQDPDMPVLTFNNYDIIFPQTITNNGHTVLLQLKGKYGNNDLPSISDGGMSNTYIFQQVHFHWGHDDSLGSEHLIDNCRYQAELHIVHYNSKYENFCEASNHPDGLAVLAILMTISGNDNEAFQHIEQFEHISHADQGHVTTLKDPIALEDLLPNETGSFYRYFGSLTTGGHNEAVTWTVFDTPITLSEKQMNMFRCLMDAKGHYLEDNFRPVQSLHHRPVFYRPSSSS